MIYPEFFPEDRKNELAEKKVFDQLKKMSNYYDIFYSRKFITDGIGKKPEYEVDFIIAIPEKAIICLEVKGGVINYSGIKDEWSQNSRIMDKRPDSQVSSASHALIKGFSDLIGDMTIGWGLCFPDCELGSKALPTSINSNQIIDQLSLLHADKALEYLFSFVKKQNPNREGVRRWMYNKFKSELLRDIGFVQVLSTRVKYNEQRFIELTATQVGVFNRLKANKKIITTGPAGSGKTIIAKTLAQDFINQDKRVLFLCFNRTLANKIRYEFDRNETHITVTTFHSFARKIIDLYDANWWKENSTSEDFWELDVPVKLEECLPFYKEKFDAIIIDEGQDFKEFWFGLIFSLGSNDAGKYIFMDEMQNIFGHYTKIPNQNNFIKYSLPENCRNTKTIINYLSKVINKEIKPFQNSPEGEGVIIKSFKNQVEEQKYLLDEIKSLTREQGIKPEQILILLNSSKADSCIGDTTKASKIDIKALDNKGRFQNNAINYTTINTFKGLEADVVFVIDIDKIPEEQKHEKLYTEASRAKHKLYVLS
ncbi:ATP-binding domain-containing protein [Nonlabens sp.]|uniref:nuclease-related domain-containing DEAD/DEAH box helicase n=1 Tax=Nonlabens sp. TaxID=1888209 RepID=UPI0032663BF1